MPGTTSIPARIPALLRKAQQSRRTCAPEVRAERVRACRDTVVRPDEGLCLCAACLRERKDEEGEFGRNSSFHKLYNNRYVESESESESESEWLETKECGRRGRRWEEPRVRCWDGLICRNGHEAARWGQKERYLEIQTETGRRTMVRLR